jgi:hypothetical protein
MSTLSDRENLRAELVGLIEEQLATLEKETLGVASDEEVQEYEVRRDRVRKLYEEFVLCVEAA